MSQPIKFWCNFMAMHSTENLAKEWTPKAEHCDIRAYVRADDYDALQAKLDLAVEALEKIMFDRGTKADQTNADNYTIARSALKLIKGDSE